jgi:hypothetical protein
MSPFGQILYDVADGVATVTLTLEKPAFTGE